MNAHVGKVFKFNKRIDCLQREVEVTNMAQYKQAISMINGPVCYKKCHILDDFYR